MHRLAIAVLFLFVAVAAIPTAYAQRANKPLALDRIVAVVNDEVVTKHELDDRVRTVIQQLQRQGTPLPPRDALESQVLERMITDRVQLQFARETGLRVDDAQLEKTLERVAEGNKMSLPQLREAVEKDGVSFAQFREEVRAEVAIARLREREVDNKLVISDSEIENFLKNAQPQDGKVDEYDISHILIRVPEQASPEQLQARRTRAEQALAQLKNGGDFRQVAATFSDAPDAVQGGNLGWREAARLPTIFAEAIKSLKPGEVSDVLRSPNGFHIVRLNDKRGQQSELIVSQTHVRHILIKTNEAVSENDAKGRLLKLKERIDNGGDFGQLARLNSEDASASRGGDLGWISPGETVPEFERAMDALKPNQVSEPVRSPFGWHLIQVLDRRAQDMSNEQQHLRARLALRQQKSDEAYQEWLRQLRDRAFVERRLEER